MAHIKNYDIRIMLITIACISFASIISMALMRVGIFSRLGGGREKDRGARIAIGAICLIVALLFYLYSCIIAPLIRLAISRTREFQADATAALITRNPQGLIGALRKISGHSEVQTLNKNCAVSAICIESPLKAGGMSLFGSLSGLLSTHPPIKDRIAALEKMDGQGLF
jgi:heat shock protein HtpX